MLGRKTTWHRKLLCLLGASEFSTDPWLYNLALGTGLDFRTKVKGLCAHLHSALDSIAHFAWPISFCWERKPGSATARTARAQLTLRCCASANSKCWICPLDPCFFAIRFADAAIGSSAGLSITCWSTHQSGIASLITAAPAGSHALPPCQVLLRRITTHTDKPPRCSAHHICGNTNRRSGYVAVDADVCCPSASALLTCASS